MTYGQGPPPGPPNPPGPPPLGRPYDGLGKDALDHFKVGQAAFLAEDDVRGGLGPVFTEKSCVACHAGPAIGGSGNRLVTRIGRITAGQFDPMIEFGGPLIQDRGIGRFNGVKFEGEVVPREARIVARRRTVPLFGLGLVDAVPDDTFVAIALQEQQFSPLTAGRPSLVADPITGQPRVGKFGWKAQQSSLFAFAGDAYQNEMGVTTPTFPSENCPQGNCNLLAANPAKLKPNDADDGTVHQLADFMTLLAPPPLPRIGPVENAGQVLFGKIGCADCHRPILQAGPSPIAPLNHAPFAPYSDFLLHDMGSLGDGIVQNQAGPREMRTAPLWGIRFERTFLHDGRAPSIEAAIIAHDGQGRGARDRYMALTKAQRDQFLAFLNAL
ncbi:MAG: hypothetical protein JWN86_71 [Planctomycetota bacterium]|nr:hypothetical protein [Planctomycetota bacterium]